MSTHTRSAFLSASSVSSLSSQNSVSLFALAPMFARATALELLPSSIGPRQYSGCASIAALPHFCMKGYSALATCAFQIK